jgi:hypothetical protein
MDTRTAPKTAAADRATDRAFYGRHRHAQRPSPLWGVLHALVPPSPNTPARQLLLRTRMWPT